MSRQRRHKSWYERALVTFGRSSVGYWYLQRIAPRVDVPLLRLTGGRISSGYPLPVTLLTTMGAKSGQPRSVPVAYIADGDTIILVASNYGRTRHPAWYWNVTGNPRVAVLAGRRTGTYIASEITDPAERERAWGMALDVYAGWADYEDRAEDRQIPLLRLARTASSGDVNR